MNYCKKCGQELTKNNTYESDSRFCRFCGNERLEFIRDRKKTLLSLREMTLEAKILQTQFLIREAVREFGLDKVYISYSGGKDSTVLSHIAKQVYPDILHIFSNTTCEYPETLAHIKWEKEHNSTNILSVLPYDRNGNLWTFKRVVEHYGFPAFSKSVSNAIRTYQHALSDETKQHSIDFIQRNYKKYIPYIELPISDKCCEVLKKTPIKKKAKELGLECSILGILASESRQRETDWINYGCNVFYIKSDNQCRPLSFWTEEDIYEYIQKYNVKIPDLYSNGYSRNGCMYCGFGVHLEPSDCNRYHKMKVTHPHNYSYLIHNFGEILEKCNINH